MKFVAKMHEDGNYRFYEICKRNKKTTTVFTNDGTTVFDNSDVIYANVKEITAEMTMNILLGKTTLDELGVMPYEILFFVDDKLELSFLQLEMIVKHLESLDDYSRYLIFFVQAVSEGYLDIYDEKSIEYNLLISNLLEFAMNENKDGFLNYYYEFKKRRNLSLKNRIFNKEDKIKVLKAAFEEEGNYAENINEACYSFLIDKELDDDSLIAKIRAYSYYCGNSFCPCDYYEAEKNLLILVENEDAYAACSLGYIYYYGRVNNGTPQYELAYKYFSIAAMAKMPEAIFKLSDMLKNGYYVNKNYSLAFNMLEELYSTQLENLEWGYDNNFADIALRLASFYEFGYGIEKNIEVATILYLLAKSAITIRMKYYPHFGDSSVLRGIDKSLERVNYLKYKVSKNENKKFMLKHFTDQNECILRAYVNSKNETVVVLISIEEKEKLVLNLNTKKYCLIDKMKIIINSNHQFDIAKFEDLTLVVNNNAIHFVNDGNVVFALAYDDINVRV